MGVMLLMVSLFGADFPICTASLQQQHPCPLFQNDQYYVFWTDLRSPPAISLYGARVSTSGTVLDPNGKFLFQDSVSTPRAAYDGNNFLVVWREGC